MNYARATRLFFLAALKNRFNAIETLKTLMRSWGVDPEPVGTGNSKTGVPSTYRPVGETCPVDCPFLVDKENPEKPGPCYAQHHWTGKTQARSTANAVSSALTAAIAIVVAVMYRSFARLQVSGDFLRDGKVDETYIDALCEISEETKACFKTDEAVAWSYTHISPEVFEPYRLKLQKSGVEVLYSDKVGPGCAVVWPFEDLGTLRAAHPGQKFAPCPAQNKKDVNCGSCNHGKPLCVVARQKGICVVFHPHGAKRKTAQRVIDQQIASELLRIRQGDDVFYTTRGDL